MIFQEICCESLDKEINKNIEIKDVKETNMDKNIENCSYGGNICGNICININNKDYEGDDYIYLDNLTLELYRITNLNELIQTTKTDKKGFYEFKNLFIDNYIIKINLPYKYKLCKKDSKSLLNQKTLISDNINNSHHITIPVKIRKLFEIKGVVFLDKSKTSIYDKESIGVNGININLYDEDDNLIQETKSIKFLSINGFFKFDNLEPKTYKITITKEEGIDFSPPRYDLEYGSKASKNFSGIKCKISDHDLDSAYIGLIYNN